MKDYWNEIKYFKPHEFDSPDEPGSGVYMEETLIRALDYIRKELEAPLRINSAYRSESHNSFVGGVTNSQHRLYKACDVHIDSQEMGDKIEYFFKDYVGDICGIGRYNTFIHIDTRNYKARWDKR